MTGKNNSRSVNSRTRQERLQLTAVSTPRSVELDKDVLVVVVHDLVKLVGDQGEDGLVLRSRDRSALQGRGQLVLGKVGDKVLDGSSVDLGSGGAQNKLLALGSHVLNDHGGEVIEGNRERLSVLGELDGVDPNEVDLVLERLGDGLDGLDESLSGLARRVDKQVGEREVGFGVDSVVFRRHLVHDRQRVFSDKGGQLVLVVGVALVYVHAFVKLLVENDSVRRKVRRGQSLVRDVSKEVGVSELVGKAAEDLWYARLGVVGHKNAKEIATGQMMRTTSFFLVSVAVLHVLQSLEAVVLGGVDL